MDLSKPIPPHPKIEPILIQRFASGRNQNIKNLQRYSLSSSTVFNIQSSNQLNKQLSKTLVSQNKLSKFEYEFKPNFLPSHSPFPTSIKYFFSQTKNLQSLTTFNLQISESFRFNTQSCLQPLIMSLASLKSLFSVRIIFCSAIRDVNLLKMLFKYTQRIKSLTDLAISFTILDAPPPSHLITLSSSLRKLRQLHSLQLNFGEPFELHEYMIDKLVLTLPKLHFLTKIAILFNEESINADAILNLFLCFSKIKTLSDITLALQSQSGKKEPISQGLSLLDPLRIRKLNLQSYQHFDSNYLIQFSEALRNFNLLHTFQFSLTIYQPSQEETAKTFISAISSLISLSSLTILLNSPHCNKIVKRISVPFRSLKNLANLNLQSWGQASHEDIQHLFFNLRLLKSLRFLAIDYPQKGIDDKNLKTLGESLKVLPFLQNLSLDFSCASLITNHGIEVLASSIKALSNLSSLKIWLKSNGKIDNGTIDQIVDVLQCLPCLYSVDLNLLLCPKITSFNELIIALKQAESIGEVALSLPSEVIKAHEISQLEERKVVKRMTSF